MHASSLLALALTRSGYALIDSAHLLLSFRGYLPVMGASTAHLLTRRSPVTDLFTRAVASVSLVPTKLRLVNPRLSEVG